MKTLAPFMIAVFALCSPVYAHQGVDHKHGAEKCCGKDGKCCKEKKECCGKEGKCCKKKDAE